MVTLVLYSLQESRVQTAPAVPHRYGDRWPQAGLTVPDLRYMNSYKFELANSHSEATVFLLLPLGSLALMRSFPNTWLSVIQPLYASPGKAQREPPYC